MNSRDDSNKDEPKPEEDIDFLVDDVERKNAEAINSLNGTRGTIFVECAFGHLKNKHQNLSLSISPVNTFGKT